MTKESQLTADELRKLIDYDRITGVLSWRVSDGGVLVGSPVKTINSNGYLVIGLFGSKYRQHRIAWLHAYGEWPLGTVDHIDGNRSNNALSNLRVVSQRLNNQNQTKPGAANKSGVLGVYWSVRLNGYMAQVSIDGKKKRRGPYKTIERAYASYVDLKRIHHEGCTL